MPLSKVQSLSTLGKRPFNDDIITLIYYYFTTPSLEGKMALPLDCQLPELEETGRVIGRGAYGEVVELLLHGTKVAGKKIDYKDRESDIITRTKQECSRLVHSTF